MNAMLIANMRRSAGVGASGVPNTALAAAGAKSAKHQGQRTARGCGARSGNMRATRMMSGSMTEEATRKTTTQAYVASRELPKNHVEWKLKAAAARKKARAIGAP